MVGHYFEKRRALATGIVACGTGVGMFVGPTLSVTLVNCYQWQGALWVTSEIVLHTAVYGVGFPRGTNFSPRSPSAIPRPIPRSPSLVTL